MSIRHCLARAMILGAMLLSGCSDPGQPGEFADWDELNEIGAPVRFEKMDWSVEDSSCVQEVGIQVLGDVDAATYSRIIAAVRTTHLREAILLVRRSERLADVLTGRKCDAPGKGGGDIYLLRNDGGQWSIKGVTQW